VCNNYVFRPPDDRLFSHLKLGGALNYPFGKPNLEPTDVRIGDRAPVVTRHDDAPALMMMPWAWKSPQGRPVFNFRSEGRDFAGSQRCLIPACGFYEFTDALPGEKRKTKWLFEMPAHLDFWIAGIVKHDAFAMLTCAPGPDIQPNHDRQVVLLAPEDGLAWLDLSQPEADLLRAAPEGSLTVRRVFPSAA
jgi:putative SOS response-associated peptidase YedK